MVRLGVIGGTGLVRLTLDGPVFDSIDRDDALTVDTPYGEVPLRLVSIDEGEHTLVFLQRHHGGGDAGCPPHAINHRANIRAMADADVDVMLAVCSVGTLHPSFPPGTVGLAEQYIDFTGRATTFHDTSSVFTSATTPFSSDHNRLLETVLRQEQGIPDDTPLRFTYWLTEGPQFETPKEVDAIQRLGGDMVGMTMPREAKLAMELNVPYVAVCIASNWAAGREPGDAERALDHHAVSAQANERLGPVMACVEALLKKR